MPFPSTGAIKLSDIKKSVYVSDSSYFLDKLSTKSKENASAAYSVRLVNSSYSGPSINVRRSSDNATQDFYSDMDGNLGTEYLAKGNSFESWLGTSNGYVTKMYDQTGNGRHVSQTTSAQQPLIGPIHVLEAISSAGKTATRGAYSLFRMSNTYTGPTIKFRRSSDNATQDFYANASGNLGTSINGTGTTFSSWITNSTAFVDTWYDQSGNGFHCTQTTTGSQPFYNQTVGVIDFNTDKWMNMGSTTGPFPTGSNPSYSFIFKHGDISSPSPSWSVAFGCGATSTNNSNNLGIYKTNDGSAYLNFWYLNDQSFGQFRTGQVITVKHDGTTQTTYMNNVFQNSATRTGLNVSVQQQLLGRDARGTSTAYNGQMYYLYVMNTSVSDIDRKIISQYEPQYGFQSNVYNPYKYQICYNGANTSLVLDSTTVGCEYPPPGTITAATTNVTGQAYGNGTYICSSSSNNSAPAWQAFGNSFWESGAGTYDYNTGNNNVVYSTSTTNLGTLTGDWLQIQLPTSIAVKTFSFAGSQTSGGGGTGGDVRSPRRFALLASTNGSTWIGISYHSGITTWRSDGRPQYFVTNIDSTNTYNYFRLVVIEMGNSYSGSGVSSQNCTTVNFFKLNPATPLTRGSMAYTMIAQCNPQYDNFGTLCEQSITSGVLASHNRSGIIIGRDVEYIFSYFTGEGNDCRVNSSGSCNTNRTIVMLCNHSLIGGVSNNIESYENGTVFKNTSTSPSSMNVAVGGFHIGRKYNNSEYFYGNINEVIVINNILTRDEALLYSAPSENYNIRNRIMPTVKPKHMLQFEPQMTTDAVRYPILQCSTSNLTMWRQDTPISTWGDFYQNTFANRPIFRKEGKYNTPFGSVLNDQPFVHFDATSSQHMTAGTRTFNIQSNGGFTVVACLKLVGTVNDNSRIMDFGNGQQNDNIIFGINSWNNMYFNLYNGSTLAGSISTSYRPSINQWFVAVARYTTSNNAFSISFNGITWNSGTTSATVTNKTFANTYIGRSAWTGDTYPNYYMSGLYAYDVSLTDSEITNVSQLLLQPNSYGIPKSITTKFENVSTVGRVFSRPVTDGHLQGLTTTNASPYYNAAQFVMSKEHGVFVDDVPGIPLSISFWVYCEDPNLGYQTFCSLTDYNRTTPVMQLDYDRGLNRFSLNFAVPDWWTTYYYTVTTNTWYHFVVTFDSNYQVKYYINGALQNTINGTSFDAGKGKSRICFGTNGDTGNRGFYGKLSDVRIYDICLRQDEITTILGNTYRNLILDSQVNTYNTPAQYLCNKTNWKTVMTWQQYGNYGGYSDDTAPYDWFYMSDNLVINSFNQWYNVTAIQNYDSFTLSFDIWTAEVSADGFFVYIGGSGAAANTYTNYGNNQNAYSINFQAYTGNANWPVGVYLLNNNSSTSADRMSTQLAYSPEMQWRNTSKFMPVTITYNKSIINTWTINVNGKDIIRYDDPNVLTWAASAGSSWGIGAFNGGLGMDTVVRAVELSYIPTNSNVTTSSLIPRGTGFSSLRNACASGLVPGFTWKFLDAIANSANILALPRASLTSNTTTLVGSTPELLTNGSFVGNTNVSQYNAAQSFGSNTIITLANPGDSPYVLQQIGSAEYEMQWTTQLVANTTYTLSGWYSKSNDYNGTDAMFHSRALSSSGANTETGHPLTNILETRVVDGLTWYFCSTTITTPADYSNSYSWFLGYAGNGTTGARYFTKLSLTRGTTATPGTHYDGTYTVTSSNTHSHANMGDRYVAFTSTNGSFGNVWSPGGGYYTNDNTGNYIGSVSTTVSGVTQSGAWLQIQLPNPIVLYSFSLNFWWTDQSYWAKSFLVAGSNDNSTWTNIYDTTTASFVYGTAQTFVTTGQPIPYRYFRLIVRKTSGIPGCDWWILDQWILNAVPINSIPYRAIGRSTNTSSIYQLTNGYVPASNTATSHLVFAEGWFLADQTGTWNFASANAGGYSHIYINGNLLTTGSGAGYSMTKGTYYRINIYYGKTSGTGSGDFSFQPPGGGYTSNWSGYIFSSTGLNSSFPAESAKVIKDITKTNTDGVYYIRLNGLSTSTYCLMNDCYDGGGWMLLMKAGRGTTFGYSSTYWTTTNTLNPSATHRVDGDAKYDAFNYADIKDVMAIWPDVPSKSYTNVLGKNGGSLNLEDGWCWKVDNWIGNYQTTALAGFQVSRDVTASPLTTWYPGWSSSIWSSEGGAYRHVFGGGSHLSANRLARWGFLWNNEANFASIDAFGGIGMDSTNYSGGDWYSCCGTAGLNRSMRVELYGR